MNRVFPLSTKDLFFYFLTNIFIHGFPMFLWLQSWMERIIKRKPMERTSWKEHGSVLISYWIWSIFWLAAAASFFSSAANQKLLQVLQEQPCHAFNLFWFLLFRRDTSCLRSLCLVVTAAAQKEKTNAAVTTETKREDVRDRDGQTKIKKMAVC